MRNPVAKHCRTFNKGGVHNTRRATDMVSWDEEFDDVGGTTACPACGNEHERHEVSIGSLGNTEHYRCRACGWIWNENIDHEEECDVR